MIHYRQRGAFVRHLPSCAAYRVAGLLGDRVGCAVGTAATTV